MKYFKIIKDNFNLFLLSNFLNVTKQLNTNINPEAINKPGSVVYYNDDVSWF